MHSRGGWLTVSVPVVVAAVLATAIWAHWPWLDKAIGTEDAPVAWLSSSLLMAGSVTALNAANLSRNRIAWCGLALLLLVMAIDERFMGHERARDWLAAGALGNAVLLAYPITAAPAVLAVLREVSGTFARRLIVAGVVVGAFAIILDVAVEIMIVQIVEECLEVVAQTLFLCGLLEAHRVRMLR